MLHLGLLACVLLAAIFSLRVDAFLVSTNKSVGKNNVLSTFIRSSTAISAKRGGPPSGAPGKTKNKKNNVATAGAASKSKKGGGPSDGTRKQTSRAAQMNQKKNQSSHAPPWQVVSKKDMAKNVQAEKKRRELAQQEGIHNVKEDVELQVSRSFLSNEDKALLGWKRFSQSPQDEIDFIGAYLEKQLPPRLGAPEVAFLGRSNVGKSSLLNKLVGSETARVGKTPGATASVNLYGMFRKEKAILGLVDLPGFGYAKLSKETKEMVMQAAENYLGKRKELMLGILLVDIRRVPSEDDRAVLAALFDMGVPIMVVATKVDKLSKTQEEESLRIIQEGLGLPEGQPFSVSSVTGQGIKGLWRIIMEACEGGVAELKAKMEQGGDVETPIGWAEYLDEDDIAYNQGFDWVHDSASVMYEDDEYLEGDDEDFGEDYDGSYDDDYEDGSAQVEGKQTLKFLRKKAKDMERRGEL